MRAKELLTSMLYLSYPQIFATKESTSIFVDINILTTCIVRFTTSFLLSLMHFTFNLCNGFNFQFFFKVQIYHWHYVMHGLGRCIIPLLVWKSSPSSYLPLYTTKRHMRLYYDWPNNDLTLLSEQLVFCVCRHMPYMKEWSDRLAGA